MLSNAQFAADDLALDEAYAAAELTREAYIAAKVALLDQFNIPSTLAAQVAENLEAQRTVTDQIGLLNLTGTVTSVGDLPGGAASGDTYLVSNNGHAYLRLTGQWKDLGPYGGRGGVAMFSVDGAPDVSLGVAGDLALDLETGDFYGPKTSGGWGAPVLATGLQAKVVAAQTAKSDAEAARDDAVAARADVVERIDPGITLRDTDTTAWAVAFIDSADRNAGGFRADGTFEPGKLKVPVAATVAGRTLLGGLVEEGVPALLGPIPEELADRYALYIADEAGNVKFAVPVSGPIVARVTSAVMAESFSPGSVGFDALSDEIALEAIPPDLEDKYAVVIFDSDNRIKFAVPKSGPIMARVTQAVVAETVADGGVSLASLAEDVTGKLASSRYIAQIFGGELFVDDRTARKRKLIAATGPSSPRIIDDAFVSYMDAGTGVEMYQPAMGGQAWPTYPERTLTLFGDSLTASVYGVSAVGSVLGISTVNRGSAGQGTTDIVMRQGGIQPLIKVVGDEIPPSGAVAIVSIDPSDGYRNAEFNFGGTLGGVPGSLQHLADLSWQFVRTDAGDAVPIPDGARFLCAQAEEAHTHVLALWTGRNNIGSTPSKDAIVRNTAGAVAYLKPLVKNFVIISVTNGTTEGIGTSNYSTIIEINQALLDVYGESFYDLRSDFIQNGMARIGMSPTSDDLAAIANDRPPPSLMGDTIHPNQAFGYVAQKLLFADWLTEKGFFA